METIVTCDNINESYKHNVKGKEQTRKNIDCVVPFIQM